jgi:tetratricopeptide (TPR) repeat protein
MHPLARARALLQAGDAEQAARLAEAVARAEPRNPTAWAVLGAAKQAQGATAEAMEAWSQAAQWAPKSPAPLIALSGMAEALGQRREASLLLQRAAALAPKDGSLLARAGVLTWESGESRAAMALWQLAVKRDPTQVLAWRNLASGWHSVQQHAKAWEAVVRARTLRPGDPELHRLEGHIAGSIGRTGDARRAFEAALALRPADPAALWGCAASAPVICASPEEETHAASQTALDLAALTAAAAGPMDVSQWLGAVQT